MNLENQTQNNMEKIYRLPEEKVAALIRDIEELGFKTEITDEGIVVSE